MLSAGAFKEERHAGDLERGYAAHILHHPFFGGKSCPPECRSFAHLPFPFLTPGRYTLGAGNPSGGGWDELCSSCGDTGPCLCSPVRGVLPHPALLSGVPRVREVHALPGEEQNFRTRRTGIGYRPISLYATPVAPDRKEEPCHERFPYCPNPDSAASPRLPPGSGARCGAVLPGRRGGCPDPQGCVFRGGYQGRRV